VQFRIATIAHPGVVVGPIEAVAPVDVRPARCDRSCRTADRRAIPECALRRY
jgi:hypothetical protein